MDALDSAESPIESRGAQILLVEDEVDVRDSIKAQLEGEGHQVVATESGSEALALAESSQFDIVLTDVMIPDINGIELVQRINQLPNHPVTIVMTGYGSVEMAVKAIKAGAFDFLSKPFSVDVLSATMASALRVKSLQDENVELKKTVRGQFSLGKLISSSQVMQEVFRLIDCVADTDSTVLILGESGTGKELIAQTIHCHSTRRRGSLIPVNCGAIPEALLESELFGHEKGAFTGAVASRVGRFELATGGTIFLDEIGDLSPPLQVKLLRVLQERTFERVGGTRTYKSDARVIAATNQDLETLVAAKQFREDLYYRLNVVPVLVPPLRQRVEDIPLLLQHFIQMFNERRKAELTGVSDEAMGLLCEYSWPGNVRELGNIVERIAILKRRGLIEPADLPEKIRRLPSTHLPTMPAAIPVGGVDLSRVVEEFENRLILEALERTNWVKSKAARLLQINRTTLIEKLKKKSLAEVVAQRTASSEDLADV
ncbi:MAG: sigma-54 dependent transcriptional regulator [Nitrospirota bacterium]|nr:sigma-54 dependent transcriptional regulator [Nitrospirota bacterium]MDH4359894.1 sigma-54 dependent transcriptional regulator [Nitrospirota bacterium]MDH5295696.1 sigma-54 dependent transcriptional regulator [Nitrospirota bacterium]